MGHSGGYGREAQGRAQPLTCRPAMAVAARTSVECVVSLRIFAESRAARARLEHHHVVRRWPAVVGARRPPGPRWWRCPAHRCRRPGRAAARAGPGPPRRPAGRRVARRRAWPGCTPPGRAAPAGRVDERRSGYACGSPYGRNVRRGRSIRRRHAPVSGPRRGGPTSRTHTLPTHDLERIAEQLGERTSSHPSEPRPASL